MTSLAAALAQRLGAAHVATDAASCALATADLFDWPGAAPAEMVIRPGNTEETATALRLLAEFGRPIVPRGAGLSYTAGVVPNAPAVVVDTVRMDGIRIDAANLTAVVGAGATWQALATALAPHGLRAAQASPISGSVSTIGGTVAQNLPGGMDGILGLSVVLADGNAVRTGALALRNAPPFWRHMGPDLTGLFLGDCGAFGVKTEVALRLAPEREAAFGSFTFESGAAMMAAMVRVAQANCVTRAFAMDPVRSRSAAKVEAVEALRTAGAVAARAGSVYKAMRDVAGLARTARASRVEPAWSLHLTADGVTEAAAAAGIEVARRLCLEAGGTEVTPSIPKALRARPYSIRGLVGPDGERWVPVHGMLSLGAASACLAALEAEYATLSVELAEAGVSISHIISSLGAYVTIEPMFYWRDALDALHLQNLSESNRARFSSFPPNPAARDLVRRARDTLSGIMDQHGAVHAQIGRFYKLGSRMEPGAAQLLHTVKAMLDPRGRMNPGALEGSQKT
ncbi:MULTISPECIES: FAD-binding oxidoreductase [Roseomonadaceae]|uniref:D-lactate dehydrogenase (cytochrome) n=1 Tax=Falsiroseomonas oleicola TaxID=2801474 RepID=A0ABS6H5J9_9PROT|nr:FAD-binding oxidoreductase [Roseomonas oleicola]MBU8543117.1 FAD-binding oxidoreductase [Roseomonas oleicola]